MNRTITNTTPTATARDKRISFSIRGKKSASVSVAARRSRRAHSTHVASPDFFRNRESLYELVDVIDAIFDGII